MAIKTQVVFDLETTGLSPKKGDRIVEIGCIQINSQTYIPTGKFLHIYLNPNFKVSDESYSIHGLSNEYLLQFGTFEDSYQKIIEFIKDDPLVAHNANFDMKFLQNEIDLIGKPALQNEVIDTLKIAQDKFPGKKVNLNALCKKFNIDNLHRKKHGALLDSELLALVYLNLMGGSQPKLFDTIVNDLVSSSSPDNIQNKNYKNLESKDLTKEEREKFKEMIQKISNSIWSNYL